MSKPHPPATPGHKPDPDEAHPAGSDPVKPVVPAEKSLTESHRGPSVPDVKPVGE
jgi:hypothetical protein